uniref:Uncharacterized protein n=1 Tax=Arundo donax TaxID=35708 RepID=A0A0A8Y2M3_ARUDO
MGQKHMNYKKARKTEVTNKQIQSNCIIHLCNKD